MAFSALDKLTCSRCEAEYEANVLHGLCPACGSPLLARYDLASVSVEPADIAISRADLWHYHEST